VIELIRSFAEDGRVHTLLVLIALDFVMGVAAAVKAGKFRLSYVSAFMKDDILGRVVPYFAVWAGVHLAGDVEVLGLGAIENAAFLAVFAALFGSFMGSVKALGLMPRLPDAIAGPEQEQVLVVPPASPPAEFRSVAVEEEADLPTIPVDIAPPPVKPPRATHRPASEDALESLEELRRELEK
jgi:hypothetical protein